MPKSEKWLYRLFWGFRRVGAFQFMEKRTNSGMLTGLCRQALAL